MRRLSVFRCLLGMTVSPAPLATAAAEQPWAWATQALDRRDLATLHLLIQTLLKNAPVGTGHPWHSASGKNGFVYLEAGGDRAGSREARVRITRTANGRETPLYVFRYRKDPTKGWAVAG